VPGFAAGLCSVTLRQLPAGQVAGIAADAGLTCVEWGADVHVPPGNTKTAADVRAACGDHGLRIASYGSYFRPGRDDEADFAPVLASAMALGAPRIRIWAGGTGSAAATPDQRRAVATATREAAKNAADQGIELAFEFHGGTLTDTADSTVRLLSDVDHPAVRTYWQPPQGEPDATALRGLERVRPWVAAVHVFSWWPRDERHPLRTRESLWRAAFALLGGPCDALLEFVPGDDPAAVATEAAALRELAGD
jgi:3-dehydroshikimate dehydratase